MKWNSGKLNFDNTLIFPAEEELLEKYVIGIQLLLCHKNFLIQKGDSNYTAFLELYEKISYSTLLDYDRAYILFQAVKATTNLNGSTAECGVYKGGASVLISTINPGKKHYAMDTFEGFPDLFTEFDSNVKGVFTDVNIAKTIEMLKKNENIVLLEGHFSDSFCKIQKEIFSLVYIDADLYKSTVECCDFFYSRLSKGGIMLFDDYISPNAVGVKKAVDDFFLSKVESPIVLPTCQAMVTKI